MSNEPLPGPPPQMLEPPIIPKSDEPTTSPEGSSTSMPKLCSNQQMTYSNAHNEDDDEAPDSEDPTSSQTDEKHTYDDGNQNPEYEADGEAYVEVPLLQFISKKDIPLSYGFTPCNEVEEGLARCFRLACSQENNARQQAARLLPQCLHDIGQNCTQEQMVMVRKMIEQLTQDSEPGVRLDLLEHLSLLSGICLNRQGSLEPFGSVDNQAFPLPPKPLLRRLHRQCIIPSLKVLMLDQVLQVRKTAHLILYKMVECRLISPPTLCKEILPTVLHLAKSSIENVDEPSTSGDLHDQRQEAATLLSKMIQFVDKKQHQKRLLTLFLQLCHDQSFHVRRACAVAMVELCQVLDAYCIQHNLLSVFLSLCDDDAWSVRKACTESFMAISCVVKPKIRFEVLAPRFLCLLNDSAKWVVAAAYQNLGPFISTFANPNRTGLELLRHVGVAQEASVRRTPFYKAPVHDKDMKTLSRMSDSALSAFVLSMKISCDENSDNNNGNFNNNNNNDNSNNRNENASTSNSARDAPAAGGAIGNNINNDNNNIIGNNNNNAANNSNSMTDSNNVNNNNIVNRESQTDDNFNSFMFWRSPLPKVEELMLAENSSKAVEEINDYEEDDEEDEDEERDVVIESPSVQSPLDEPSTSGTSDTSTGTANSAGENDAAGKADPSSETDSSNCGIPILLLEHFKQMLEPSLAQTIDCLDLPRNCAYSLPAVALALGPAHWEEHLRELLLELSINVQRKVRHLVASSLHSLVIIVGDRDAVKFIIPMFIMFCRDVDEVRLPLLRNLHIICAHLEPRSRLLLLHSLSEFTRGENFRMWRLRDELANQILLISGYYKWDERLRYLFPLLVKLLQDKVAQVRLSAAACIGPLIWNSFTGSSSSVSNSSLSNDSNCSNLSSSDSSESGFGAESLANSSSNLAAGGDESEKATHRWSISSRGISCSYEALDLIFRSLCADCKWVKWQHRQTFAKLLTSIVERIPYNYDILEGSESPEIKRAAEDIGPVCPDCVGLRNMAVVNKLIRHELLALLEHRVPNVRLEVANLLSKMLLRGAEILSLHKQNCAPCRSRISAAVQSVGHLRPSRRRLRPYKAASRAVADDAWDTDTEATSPTLPKKEIVVTVNDEQQVTGAESEALIEEKAEAAAEPNNRQKDDEENQRQEQNSDSDSSQENDRKRCEVLSLLGLVKLPNVFAILLSDLDEDVCRVAKDAISCFVEKQKVP